MQDVCISATIMLLTTKAYLSILQAVQLLLIIWSAVQASREEIFILSVQRAKFSVNFEESKFYVSKIDPSHDAHNGECRIEEIDLNVNGDMVALTAVTAAADERLAEDFVKFHSG